MPWHGEGVAGAGWKGPAMVVTVSWGSWLLLHSQAQQGERVLMGHLAEMPQLALPKTASEETKHLTESGRGLQSPIWDTLCPLGCQDRGTALPHQICLLPEKPTSAQPQRTGARAKRKQSHLLGSPSDLALKTQFEGGIREVRYRLSGATDPIYKLTCSACESGGRDIYQFLPSRLTQAHKFGQFPRAASSLQ